MHEQRDCAVQQIACSVAPCTTDVGLQASSWPGCVSSAMHKQPVPVGLQEIVEPLESPPAPPTAPPPAPTPPTGDPGGSPLASQPPIANAATNATLETNTQRLPTEGRAAIAASIGARYGDRSSKIEKKKSHPRTVTFRRAPGTSDREGHVYVQPPRDRILDPDSRQGEGACDRSADTSGR